VRGENGSTVPSDFNPPSCGGAPEPDTLDPQLARTDGAFNILRDVFEGLTAIGPDGSPVPAAAESWTVTPDGLEYRFTLRDGLRWSNGDALVAADFVAGMRRLVDPRTARPTRNSSIGTPCRGDARGEKKPENSASPRRHRTC
jgi:ABC-type oligopeptide transport system substrate-binding subunit